LRALPQPALLALLAAAHTVVNPSSTKEIARKPPPPPPPPPPAHRPARLPPRRRSSNTMISPSSSCASPPFWIASRTRMPTSCWFSRSTWAMASAGRSAPGCAPSIRRKSSSENRSSSSPTSNRAPCAAKSARECSWRRAIRRAAKSSWSRHPNPRRREAK